MLKPCKNCIYSKDGNALENCDCDEYRKYQEYMLKKNRYKKGKKVTDINEILREKRIYFGNKTISNNQLMNMKCTDIYDAIDDGKVFLVELNIPIDN